MQRIIFLLFCFVLPSVVRSASEIAEAGHNSSIPTNPAINVTCGQNRMSITIPKVLLPGIDQEHLRLSNLSCGATEAETSFTLLTELTACHTKSKHNKHFVVYSNKVEEIPIGPNQIITRVREVEIPFSCYYSNTGVVSAVGLKVESRKIIFSRKGFGKFVLEMKIFPTKDFQNKIRKTAFPFVVQLRQILYVEVSVESDDSRLSILAETCFATPDPDPTKEGLKYTFIDHGCPVDVDDTVHFLPTDDSRTKRYEIEAFSFVGDHQFVYMHCKVRICNASDPHSRCAKGCIPPRERRSLNAVSQSKDEEAYLAEGPFMRGGGDEDETKDIETEKDIRVEETSAMHSTLVAAMAVMAVACVLGVSYFALEKRKQRALHQYQRLTVPSDD